MNLFYKSSSAIAISIAMLAGVPASADEQVFVNPDSWNETAELSGPFQTHFGATSQVITTYTGLTGAIFNSNTNVIELLGSAGDDTSLQNFITANSAALSNWVSAGGQLVVQSSGFDTSITLPDGSQLVLCECIGSGSLTAAGIASFTALPAPTAMTGSELAHDYITLGTGLTGTVYATGDTGTSQEAIIETYAEGLGSVALLGLTSPTFNQVSAGTGTTTAWYIDALPAAMPGITPGISLASQLGTSFSPQFEGGTLLMDQPGATYSQNFTLDNSGTNTIDQNGNSTTFTGVFSDATTGGTLIIANSGSGGSVTLTGTNTYTGATTIDAGATLALSGTGSIATSSTLAANGTFDISGNTAGALIQDLSGSGTVDLGNQTLTLTNASGTFAGTIADGGLNGGTGGALTVAGGTATLSGTNTYTGATTINSGATLALSGTGSIATSSTVAAGGTFDISGTTAGTAIEDLSGNGTVNLGNQVLTLTNAGSTFAGTIADGGLNGGTGGALTVAGGTATLSGTETYTGATTVNTGATLALTGTGSIATSSTVDANGTFDISATTAGAAIQNLSGNGTINLGNQMLTLTNASSTFAGTIADSGTGGALTVAGGTATLSGANTYTGMTTINPGATLALSGNGAIGTSGDVVADGTFDISQASAAASIQSLGGAGAVVLGGNALVITNGGDTFSGAISGAGALVITGGTQTLAGANSYTGDTMVTGGTLQLATGGTLGGISGATIITGGLLDLGGTTQVQNGGLQIQGGTLQNGTLSSSGMFYLQGGSVSAVLAGSANALQTTGTTTLSGANTYTGATMITGGTLALAGNGSIAASAVIDDATLDVSAITGGQTSIGALTGNGQVTLGATTLAIYSANGTFAGVIAGSGGLTVAGGGQILTGTNTYAGFTSIALGASLQIGNGGTSGAVAGTIFDNGTLVYDRSDAVTVSQAITGIGALTQAGTGTLLLLGYNTVSGRVTVAAGNLEVGNAANPGAVLDASAGGVVVGAQGTLSGHGTINGAVTNTAGGTVRPGGSVGTLSVGSYTQGANSTLAIEISPTQASQLQVAGNAAIAGTVAVTFDAGTYRSHVYPILTAGSITGTFNTLAASGASVPGYAYGLFYAPTGKEVDLVLASTLTASVYGDTMTAALDSADAYAETILNHRDECSGTDAAKGSTVCGANGIWMKIAGSTGNTDGNGPATASGFHANRGTLVGGYDHTIGAALTLGAAFGWSHTSTNASDYAASAKLDQYNFGLYAAASLGTLQIDADGFYNTTTTNVTRDTQGAGTATARFNGHGYGAALRASAPLPNSALTPFAELRWAYQVRDALVEEGADELDFAIDRQSHDTLHGALGGRFQRAYTAGSSQITPHIEIGVDQQFAQPDRTVYGRLANLTSAEFAAGAVNPARTAAVIKLGLTAQIGRSVDLFGDLGDRHSGNQDEASGSIGLRLRF